MSTYKFFGLLAFTTICGLFATYAPSTEAKAFGAFVGLVTAAVLAVDALLESKW